ncbi:MAG: hypothetical protein ACLFVO_15660 [Chloroflexaceae bacterium]
MFQIVPPREILNAPLLGTRLADRTSGVLCFTTLEMTNGRCLGHEPVPDLVRPRDGRHTHIQKHRVLLKCVLGSLLFGDIEVVLENNVFNVSNYGAVVVTTAVGAVRCNQLLSERLFNHTTPGFDVCVSKSVQIMDGHSGIRRKLRFDPRRS